MNTDKTVQSLTTDTQHYHTPYKDEFSKMLLDNEHNLSATGMSASRTCGMATYGNMRGSDRHAAA
jgi:hypothetical protein